MKSYSVKACADVLGLAPRTLRRWLAAGDVPGAHQVDGKHGAAWRIPADALDALRNRVAVDVDPIPVVELGGQGDHQARAEHTGTTTGDAHGHDLHLQRLGGQVDHYGKAVALLAAVQAATSEAVERERTAARAVADAMQRTIDDQARTIADQAASVASLYQLVDGAQAMLRDERQAHAHTRGELGQLRGQLGLRTRTTVPLRVIDGGEG